MNAFIASLCAEFQFLFSVLGVSAALPTPVATPYPVTYEIEMEDYDVNQTKFQIPEYGNGEIRDYNYTVVSSENGMRSITPIDPTQPMNCSVVIHCEIRDGKIVG